jgi:lipid-A-disaccharide synthase
LAGEASGDLHGFHLMGALRKLAPHLSFRGVGGPKMEKAGLLSIVNFQRLAVMGFLEVIKDLFFFIKTKKIIINDIKLHRPKKIILIDYPGFNLALAKEIKKHLDIPVLFYVSPQVWAWKEKRIKKIKKYIDKLIVIFPFEVSWFKQRGVDVEYFGHPLIDLRNAPLMKKKEPSLFTVGLFTGSREQEIEHHLPLLEETIALLRKTNSKIRFVVCLAPGINIKKMEPLQKLRGVEITADSRAALCCSSVAIVASGTATLECALSNTPFVVIYKTSLISWLLAKYLIAVDYVCIVNILANKKVVEELLQNEATPQNVVVAVLNLLDTFDVVKKDLSLVADSLGNGRAYDKTAKFILKY